MTFTEQNADGRWTYGTEDVFGTIEFSGPRLDASELDRLAGHLIPGPSGEGALTIGDKTVNYKFQRANPWEEE